MKTSSPLRLAFSYVRKHKSLLFLAIGARAVWELIPMQIPVVVGAIVDGLSGEPVKPYGFEWGHASPLDVVRLAIFSLLAIALLHSASAYFYTLAGARLDRRFVTWLRKAIADKVTSLSLDLHQRYGTGDLLDRTLRDTDKLRGFTDRVFVRTCTNVIRSAYPIAMLFVIDPFLALIALSVIPPQWFVTWKIQKKLHVATETGLVRHSDLTSSVKETLDGLETLKSLNAEAPAIQRIYDRVDGTEAAEFRAYRCTALMRGAVWFFTGLGIALIWWQGGMRVASETMTLGVLVVFTGFAEFAYRPFRYYTDIVRRYRQGFASLDRIRNLLEARESVADLQDAPPLRVSEGIVEFRGVSFGYGPETVLGGVDLSFEPRSFTVVIGRSGSGKSSLLRLIARLYAPSSGSVLVDGQDVGAVQRHSLRAQVAFVPQSTVLYSGTVLENLLLGNPGATRQEVEEACRAASALDFIQRLDNGFETLVGSGGVSLSGGQAQRIAIARALLRRPKVLLMDEPTSALDAESEARIVETLRSVAEHTTVIVVAHRSRTISAADRVVVMERGRVMSAGHHEDLLEPALGGELFSSSRARVASRVTSRVPGGGVPCQDREVRERPLEWSPC